MSAMTPDSDEATRNRGEGQQGTGRRQDTQHDTGTAKTVAILLLVFYGGSLGAIALAAYKEQNPGAWFDLFKSGFLLLGGALTTVIGYYFGSRGVQAAERSAAFAVQEATKAGVEKDRALKQVEQAKEKESPTREDIPLEEPPAE
ncbi:MAG: hypothetical protein QOH63_3246 [Acidobacteriota bacterium]|jgi:hypothetical protein|nr:hypothetical protein [Acidobacteriota bacterium]